MKTTLAIIALSLSLLSCKKTETIVVTEDPKPFSEDHRPQFHFTPPHMWMNDPNGMVYHKGEYHLFYQHYPDSTVWGPMHWGHAISKDLVYWEHLPIALYPDSLGMIFSGGAVVDENNTSGFGTAENPPLVAIYTYHKAEMEKQGRNDYQTQGLAYSLDNGRTWKKYENNPVINNPGFRDFRDPKFFWHEGSKKWILVLVAGDHALLYGSKDLKSWTKLSEFGKEFGSHGGVWECPDLFPLVVEGENKTKWIMIININPGGPNGGSGTQYFVGDFDGQKFICDTDKSITSWIDYGPDNYAGVTWSNAPDDKKIFFGWMSNWAYGQAVPTDPWRSANTVPRELKLTRVNNSLHVRSVVWQGLDSLKNGEKQLTNLTVKDSLDVTAEVGFPVTMSTMQGEIEAKNFHFAFLNGKGQQVKIGFDSKTRKFFIDRKRSGKTDFSPDFIKDITAPRILTAGTIKFTMVVDVSSVEVFFDDGLTVMTALFFPDEDLSQLKIYSSDGVIKVDSLKVSQLSSIW
jgi:fructan beta-fructosidase